MVVKPPFTELPRLIVPHHVVLLSSEEELTPPDRVVSTPFLNFFLLMLYQCAPGRIRTYDPEIRRLLLCPAELRGLGLNSLT